ncbi:hypothetical protein RJ640_024215 [Escallonia rubra]|uniref:RRM domain-containing protein n=1 Tax=Escallonia rubra TaxID=112253 RepID=A0AA88UJ48_9ASTE|nr:hypothetical protein RJ640_024215 [Escallonia rubra]
MESKDDGEYAAFEEKVTRTVFLDNLSPQVTESVLKTAFNQFGSVTNVQFIPYYIEPLNIPLAALVEMENPKQAKQIISEMANFLFMMSGMPRPVRVSPAVVEMFEDRPRKPGTKIESRWLNQNDPHFVVAKKIKNLTRRHAAERSFMLKRQLEDEEKLANQQAETLRVNSKKLKLINNVLSDGTVSQLARRYKMKITEP